MNDGHDYSKCECEHCNVWRRVMKLGARHQLGELTEEQVKTQAARDPDVFATIVGFVEVLDELLPSDFAELDTPTEN